MKFNLFNRLQPLRFILKPRLLGTSAAVIAAVGGVLLLMRHAHAQSAAADAASISVVPTVAVAKVCREDLYKKVTIPAEFRPV